MGSAAHVRPGTLLEERARAAHTVGLKQTILFPYATLGSLINFCDAFLAGGSGPKDHSEVGSGFIHFNFTPRGPHGDKATPSLFGDVPRGVLLDQPRIFFGGDGGVVGPVQVGYGAVLAAGSTYRRDCPAEVLRSGEATTPYDGPFDGLVYGDVTRKWRLNVLYVANLVALWHWYEHVRCPSIPTADPLGRDLVRAGQRVVAGAIAERLKRLQGFADALQISLDRLSDTNAPPLARPSQEAVVARWPHLRDHLEDVAVPAGDSAARERFLAAWSSGDDSGSDYLSRIHDLGRSPRDNATTWLQSVVDDVVEAGDLVDDGHRS